MPNATPADLAAVDNYLDSLRIAGVNIEGHRESLLSAGFTVCDDLRSGTGEQVEVAVLMGADTDRIPRPQSSMARRWICAPQRRTCPLGDD
jgi:Protein of unknown function (DUF732)